MNETDELAIALMAAAAKWAAGAVAEYNEQEPEKAARLAEDQARGEIRYALQVIDLLGQAPMLELLTLSDKGAEVIVAQQLHKRGADGWTLQ